MARWSEVSVQELGGFDRLDAEYYDPELLGLEDRLEASGWEVAPLGELVREGARVVYESTEILAEPELPGDGVQFLQAAAVSSALPVVETAALGWVRTADWERYPNGRIRPGEVLVEVKGKAEKVAIVPDDISARTLVTGTLFKFLVDETRVSRNYLVAYLLSRYGRSFRTRTLVNTLIGFVSKDELYRIPVAIPSRGVQEDVAAAVARCLNADRVGRIAYAEADHAASAALPSVTQKPSLSWSTSANAAARWERLDAEYFQPAKWQVLEAMGSQPNHLLEEQFEVVRELFVPGRAESDDVVRNYDLSDALTPFLDPARAAIPASEVGSTKLRLRTGDLVISRLRSYLRQIALVIDADGVPAVGSTEFIVLRPCGVISAEALLVFLRSSAAQVILKWSQDGSNHPRFDNRMLLGLPIPRSLLESQSEIQGLVTSAIAERRRAEAELSTAIELVEKAIG
jgi:hypothetical protein